MGTPSQSVASGRHATRPANLRGEREPLRRGELPRSAPILMAFVLLSHGIPGQTLITPLAVDAHADHGLGCRAGGAQDRYRRESLVINFGDQEGFTGFDFPPYLADLNALGCH